MSKQSESVVNIWRIPTTDNPVQLAHYCELLSDDEIQRSNKIMHPEACNTYVTVHAVLRSLLGQQLNLAPKSIQFDNPPNKKPRISHADNISFNLSHSQSVSIIAVSKQHEVGVDIETMQTKRNINAIAQRFFTKKESDWIAGMNEKMKSPAFHQLWCHKEALLKGQGSGLQGGLDIICLAEHDLNKPFYYKDWSILSLSAPENEKAAIAVNSKQIKINEYTWTHNT